MSSSSSLTPSLAGAVMVFTAVPSLDVLRGLWRVGVWRREVGKCGRRRLRRLGDSVKDGGGVFGVGGMGEDRFHLVAVGGLSVAGLIILSLVGGDLALVEGALLCLRA